MACAVRTMRASAFTVRQDSSLTSRALQSAKSAQAVGSAQPTRVLPTVWYIASSVPRENTRNMTAPQHARRARRTRTRRHIRRATTWSSASHAESSTACAAIQRLARLAKTIATQSHSTASSQLGVPSPSGATTCIRPYRIQAMPMRSGRRTAGASAPNRAARVGIHDRGIRCDSPPSQVRVASPTRRSAKRRGVVVRHAATLTTSGARQTIATNTHVPLIVLNHTGGTGNHAVRAVAKVVHTVCAQS